jgi:hypothetical protein
MSKRRCASLLVLLASLACQDPEKMARHMKEPLAEVADRTALDAAYQEARTRLTAVRDGSLWQQLTQDIALMYDQRLAKILEEEAATAERARLLAVEQERAAAALRMREAVSELEAQYRLSAFADGTKVLVLTNRAAEAVRFELKCFTVDGTSSKTFFVNIAARGTWQLGFLEGWSGNFVSGERCEAFFGEERLWVKYIP